MDKVERSGQTPDENDGPAGKVVLLHGFSAAEINAVLRAVKSAVEDPQDIAFAMTTPTNMGWKVRDFIADVRGDHEYLKANPPGRKAT
jgi:3-deoxy-D-manno-octulosonic-acid transferase